MNLVSTINCGWMLACRPRLRRFHRSTRDVARTQARVLMDVVSSNRRCAYAREHGFESICNVEHFRERVPIANYEDLEPWIDQICRGSSHMLTQEPVRLLEPTSGSVSGRRLIPYTKSLQRQFQNGIDPWIGDLFNGHPEVRRGRAYWLVTPAVHAERTACGLPIGFEDDADYLGPVGKWAAQRVMAVPSEQMRDLRPEQTRLRTLRLLLEAQDLSLISVWSPSFLTTLMDSLEASSDQLVAALGPGHRASGILRSSSTLPERIARLWPQLAVISCWADGAASTFLDQVRNLFPGVMIQPKGLIATEAFVSLPLVDCAGSALSIRSHFFEFQNIDRNDDATLLAHELEETQSYRVIATTAGGLYRYQMHDVIEVTGFHRQCPLIRFVGRGNRTSDLVGEKLSEVFVARSIDTMNRTLASAPAFAMLVPRRDRPGYRLLIEFDRAKAGQAPSPQNLAETLEPILSRNPYYKHAIEVEQLAHLVVTTVHEDRGSLWNIYEQLCLQAGMRQGDIKPTALETRFDWETAISQSATAN
jgi:hypothetical protein